MTSHQSNEVGVRRRQGDLQREVIDHLSLGLFVDVEVGQVSLQQAATRTHRGVPLERPQDILSVEHPPGRVLGVLTEPEDPLQSVRTLPVRRQVGEHVLNRRVTFGALVPLHELAARVVRDRPHGRSVCTWVVKARHVAGQLSRDLEGPAALWCAPAGGGPTTRTGCRGRVTTSVVIGIATPNQHRTSESGANHAAALKERAAANRLRTQVLPVVLSVHLHPLFQYHPLFMTAVKHHLPAKHHVSIRPSQPCLY